MLAITSESQTEDQQVANEPISSRTNDILQAQVSQHSHHKQQRQQEPQQLRRVQQQQQVQQQRVVKDYHKTNSVLSDVYLSVRTLRSVFSNLSTQQQQQGALAVIESEIKLIDEKCDPCLLLRSETLRRNKRFCGFIDSIFICEQPMYIDDQRQGTFNPKIESIESYHHPTSNDFSVLDIVHRAVHELLLNLGNNNNASSSASNVSWSSPGNVLCRGFRLRSASTRNVVKSMTGAAIESFYHNTIVDLLCVKPWRTVLSMIGPRTLYELLTKTSIFQRLANGNFIQLTGEPITSTVMQMKSISAQQMRMHSSDTSNVQSYQRTNSSKSSNKLKITNKISSSANPLSLMALGTEDTRYVSRHRIRTFHEMFYRKPLLNRARRMIIELPRDHPLQRLALMRFRHRDACLLVFGPERRVLSRDEAQKQTHIVYGYSRDCDELMLHLMTYVFPQGFANALHRLEVQAIKSTESMSAFESQPKRWNKNIKSNDFRFNNTRKNFALLSDNYANLDLMKLLNKTCPYRKIRNPKNVLGYVTRSEDVHEFVVSIVNNIVPLPFFGTEQNRDRVLENIRTFVTLKKFDIVALEHLVSGVRFSDITLFGNGEKDGKRRHLSVDDEQRRRLLFREFLSWLVFDFLASILRAAFYITDTSVNRSMVVFYRHDMWKKCNNMSLRKFRDMCLEPVEFHPNLTVESLGLSKLRLLPKKQLARPILNFSRRNSMVFLMKHQRNSRVVAASRRMDSLSINQQLMDTLQVLIYQSKLSPQYLQTVFTGEDEVHKRLTEFATQNLDIVNDPTKRFSICKLDIESAYNSVLQQPLLELLEKYISEPIYTLYRYEEVKRLPGRKPIVAFKREAVEEHLLVELMSLLREVSGKKSGSVFVSGVSHPTIDRATVLHLLRKHLLHNIVEANGQLYRQKIGIPQGSILSTMLFSLFFGMVELEAFETNDILKWAQERGVLLLRYVDDYLVIARDPNVAVDVVTRIQNVFRRYNCRANSSKTMSHLVTSTTDMTRKKDRYVTWCQYDISCETLQIQLKRSVNLDTGFEENPTVLGERKPGRLVMSRVRATAATRLSFAQCDVNLNGRAAVRRNVMFAAQIATSRLATLAESMPFVRSKFVERVALKSVLRIVSSATYELRCKHPNGRSQGAGSRDVKSAVSRAFNRIGRIWKRKCIKNCSQVDDITSEKHLSSEKCTDIAPLSTLKCKQMCRRCIVARGLFDAASKITHPNHLKTRSSVPLTTNVNN